MSCLATVAEGFIPIRTKASAALQKDTDSSFRVTVFEPKKAALERKKAPKQKRPAPEDVKQPDTEEEDIDDIFSDAPRKRRKKPTDPTEFDLAKARKDVINFGISGLDKVGKQSASVALAIKLGAKPPKNKYRNYREILNERKAVLESNGDVSSRRRQGQVAFGAIQSFSSAVQRKREKQRNPSGIMKNYGVAKTRTDRKKK